MKQIDIRVASWRILHDTPGHVTIGIWINNGKAGDLTVRREEQVAFTQMLSRAGIKETQLSPPKGAAS